MSTRLLCFYLTLHFDSFALHSLILPVHRHLWLGLWQHPPLLSIYQALIQYPCGAQSYVSLIWPREALRVCKAVHEVATMTGNVTMSTCIRRACSGTFCVAMLRSKVEMVSVSLVWWLADKKVKTVTSRLCGERSVTTKLAPYFP